MPRWDLDDLPVFAAVAEQEGVTAAARRLGMPKSTVSKALARLETALGHRLVERNTRRVRLTGEGEAFYAHARLILDQVDEAEAVMGGLAAEPGGRLVVALPIAFAREIVAAHLEGFRRRHPRIELELLVTTAPVDIIRDQIDLAVVVGRPPESDLVVRTLLRSGLVWVTSPAYAAEQALGATPEALAPHIRIAETRYAERPLQLRLGEARQTLALGPEVIRVSDPITVREAVAAGCGVSFLPEQYAAPALRDGRLVRIAEALAFDTEAASLSAVYPSRRLIPARTRAFLDFLVAVCEGV